jgi:uncharacterized protein YndB with AHSA1/START domain
MNPDTVREKTGKTPNEWFKLIGTFDDGSRSHKEVANWLHESCGVSYWWAQTICGLWEQDQGKRVVGQTERGLFQVGVSRTFSLASRELWTALVSSRVMGLLTGLEAPLDEELMSSAAEGSDGIWFEITTYKPDSHIRMKWQHPDWERYSILQLRVTPKGPDRSTLGVHHENLPSQDVRDRMRVRWKGVADTLEKLLG